MAFRGRMFHVGVGEGERMGVKQWYDQVLNICFYVQSRQGHVPSQIFALSNKVTHL